MENDIKYKSLKAGRRSLGSQGPGLPLFLERAPIVKTNQEIYEIQKCLIMQWNCQAPRSFESFQAQLKNSKIAALKLKWNQIKIGFTNP